MVYCTIRLRNMLLILGYVAISMVSCTAENDSHNQTNSFHLDYVDLATDVLGIFQSSSVFIVNADHCENLPESIVMTKLLKEFSRKYVLCKNINFTKLYQEVEYYNGRSVQPLFVVVLKSLNELYQFSNTTESYNMSLHTWLIMFQESKDKELNSFCQTPGDNILNLVVSTKMLVKCYNNSLLREWYSIDQRKIEVFEYGIWNSTKGITKFSKQNFYERRSDLKGISLKVSFVKDSGLIRRGKGPLNTFFGAVCQELSLTLNFKMEFISEDEYYGSWNTTSHKWTGVIGRLAAREVDIGIGEFTMNIRRANVIDFTVPLMLSYSDIYVKRQNMSTVYWSAYIKAFHDDIWLLIALFLIISPILLTFIYKISNETEINYWYLVEEYLTIWGIYCQKSLPAFPTLTSLRIAYFSIFMSSLVLFAVYSAYLTSYLTIFAPSIPFNSFEGFVVDGSYKLIVLRKSSNHDIFTRSDQPIISKMGKLLKPDEELPNDIFEAVNQVCNEKAVLYTNELLIQKVIQYSPCALTSLTQGKLDNVGFGLPKNSPYTELFNYHLKNLRAFGIIGRLKYRFLKKITFDDSSYMPVALWSVIPILGVLGFGVIISLQLLICEWIAKRKSKTLIKRNDC